MSKKQKCLKLWHKWYYLGRADSSDLMLRGDVYQCTKCGQYRIEDGRGGKNYYASHELWTRR